MNVLQEANQVINPKLQELAARGGGGGYGRSKNFDPWSLGVAFKKKKKGRLTIVFFFADNWGYQRRGRDNYAPKQQQQHKRFDGGAGGYKKFDNAKSYGY